jgi:4-hydroxy-4-methyl-2-oxoglutarate aldolase
MIAYTSTNPYERFPDGRPKVPDDLLAKVNDLVIEEAYGAVRGGDFPNQFAGDRKILNPGKKRYRRARPDFFSIILVWF